MGPFLSQEQDISVIKGKKNISTGITDNEQFCNISQKIMVPGNFGRVNNYNSIVVTMGAVRTPTDVSRLLSVLFPDFTWAVKFRNLRLIS